MGVNVSEQREQQGTDGSGAKKRDGRTDTLSATQQPGILAQFQNNLREGFGRLQWRLILLFGVTAGTLMALSFVQSGLTTIIAGLIPVGTGLLLARRVKGFYGLHGFVTGIIAAAVSTVILTIVFLYTPVGATLSAQAIAAGQPPAQSTPEALFAQSGGFSAISLIIFCAFGASMAGRTEERNREARAAVEARGGRLERASTIRNADDIRGLSLPQLGGYISNLFKKQGFTLKDYRFLDKDKHLDMWMERENEVWHLRLNVADKVSPGTVEGLSQEMKREGCRKGIVITSTEFLPGAVKAAKSRPIVLIDGPTLYDIAEG